MPDLIELHLDVEVSRFLGGVRTPAATEAYLQTNLNHWTAHGLGLWTLRARDGTFVGRAGLRHVELEGAAEMEVAYTLARFAWGQGLATEIVQALVGEWEKEGSQPSLVGIVMKGNAASERVLQKVGFFYEREVAYHGEACVVFRRLR